MWRKTDGKPSPEVSSARRATPTKPQPPATVTPEPLAPPATPPGPAAAPLAPTPQIALPEPAASVRAAEASRIHAGLKIHGEISGNSDLYIDGELQGKIRLGNAKVVIGPSGKVQADVEAGSVTIEGFLQGNIKAGEGVKLGSNSRVQGSIVTPRIGMDDGARLRGKVEMVRTTSPATAAVEAVSQATASRSEEPEVARAAVSNRE